MDEHPENDQGQQMRGRRGVRTHGGRVQRQNRGRGRREHEQRRISDEIRATVVDHVVDHGLQWLKGAAKYWGINHILNISNILKQSLSINIPHTVMCKFVLLKWIYVIRSAAFCISVQYSNCHPNCCHTLHLVILTQCTVILTTWLSILPILFVNNDTRTFHYDATDMSIDINTYFWEMN